MVSRMYSQRWQGQAMEDPVSHSKKLAFMVAELGTSRWSGVEVI